MDAFYPGLPIKFYTEFAVSYTIQGALDLSAVNYSAVSGSLTWIPSRADFYAWNCVNSLSQLLNCGNIDVSPLVDKILSSLVREQLSLMTQIEDVENGRVKQIQDANGVGMTVVDIGGLRVELDRVNAKIADYKRNKLGLPPFKIIGIGGEYGNIP